MATVATNAPPTITTTDGTVIYYKDGAFRLSLRWRLRRGLGRGSEHRGRASGGRKRFDVDAETGGDMLRALSVADVPFTERDEWSEHLNVFVDGVDVRRRVVSRVHLRASAKCEWSA